MSELLQYVVAGVCIGSIYTLFALGIALVFGIGNVLNFAHGALITVAGYVLYAVSGWVWPAIAACAIGAAVVLAVAMERFAYRPVRAAPAGTLFIVAFALNELLRSTVALVAGETALSVGFGGDLTRPVGFAGVNIAILDLVTLGITVALMVAGGVFLRHSEFGLNLRAASEDFGMAQLVGIKADAVMRGVFALSGVFAGVGAVLWVARSGSLTPELGLQPVLIAFVATVLGGLGSLSGAAVGGYVLGGMTIFFQAALPSDLQGYDDTFLYGAVILILLFRPQGLLPNKRWVERV
jgi:branched-chain amino acid transport system permease protein